MGPFGGIGLPEIIIVLVIVLVIFGPKRLPGLGRSLGSGLREFKDSVSSKDSGSGTEIAETAERRGPAEPVAQPDGGGGTPERVPQPDRGTEAREPVSAQPASGGGGAAPRQERAG
jgi:sec-independent protein translocase protein TatA